MKLSPAAVVAQRRSVAGSGIGFGLTPKSYSIPVSAQSQNEGSKHGTYVNVAVPVPLKAELENVAKGTTTGDH
jgi:hypothetical protein